MIRFKKLKYFKTLVLTVSIIGFTSCTNEPIGNNTGTPTTPTSSFLENFGSLINSDFMGRVVDPQNNPISGAVINIGNQTIYTSTSIQVWPTTSHQKGLMPLEYIKQIRV